MQLQFQRDTLLKPLMLTAGFVEKKHTMPILSNVYLKKEGALVTLIANDMEAQVTLVINEGFTGGDFTITLPAKKFQDILKAIPDGEVKLVIEDNKVVLKSGRTKFTLQSVPADHYPLLKLSDDCIAKFSLAQKELKNLLTKVQYAMAVNDSRVFLNGMLLEVKTNQLNLVATDAHRLSLASFNLGEELADLRVTLPRKTILELFRILEDSDKLITIKIYPTQVVFELDSKELITKVIDGRYPDYDRVIPLTNDKLALINRQELLQALQRIAVIGIDKLRTLVFEVSPNTLKLSCKNEDGEESNDELSIQYGENQELRLNFNINYVMEVLQNSTTENLQWAFFDNFRSILVTIPNEVNFKYVIMPLKS